TGEARQAGREETESRQAMHEPESPANTIRLMEEVCERENLLEALRRVKGNKGSAGIDGMTVGQLSGYLKEHWLTIREQLLNGTYKPQPVRRVEIERSEEHTSELQSPCNLVCRLLLEKKNCRTASYRLHPSALCSPRR